MLAERPWPGKADRTMARRSHSEPASRPNLTCRAWRELLAVDRGGARGRPDSRLVSRGRCETCHSGAVSQLTAGEPRTPISLDLSMSPASFWSEPGSRFMAGHDNTTSSSRSHFVRRHLTGRQKRRIRGPACARRARRAGSIRLWGKRNRLGGRALLPLRWRSLTHLHPDTEDGPQLDVTRPCDSMNTVAMRAMSWVPASC